jgi:class 3 adenylate cyclase/tetratricopeptide (TPR) repeat protein
VPYGYVPRLAIEWLAQHPERRHMTLEGSMAFVDISGFTVLTERLARKGRVGAEEMSDILNRTFGMLLRSAQPDGADLIKWGGDAVLLLFRGPDHALHAARAGFRMRKTLRALGRQHATAGAVTLRMSVGIHSGRFTFFLVGDPAIHRELIVCGPATSTTAEMESLAGPGQIAVSDATAALLRPAMLGARIQDGRLLRSEPRLPDTGPASVEPADVEPGDELVGVEPSILLAPPIRRHLLVAVGESEHRPISVAFVRFSGTDGLLHTAGPDAATAALDDCIRNVQHAAAEHEVTFLESDIARNGGKIMLVAGAPRSRGHDEERMLRAVRQIIDGAGTLSLAAGVNRGPVFSGDFGPDFRRTYSVKGDAVNLAARVMAKARAGQAIATRDVVARSRTAFAYDALPPFAVKGKSRPVQAVVLGRIDEERHDQSPVQAGDFVGRARELAVLGRALDDVRDGRGALIEVVGEPGLGKSRLVNETCRLATDIYVVDGPCGSYHSNTAYYPFRTLLRRILGVAAGSSRASAARRLAEVVRDDAPQLQPWLPLLGVALDIEMPPTKETAELDEMFRGAKLAEVTVEFLRSVLPQPSLLVFDNVHLVDDASADLLRRMADEVHRQPWLMLVTRRDRPTGFVPDLSAGYRRLVLTPIDASAALELLASTALPTPLGPQAMSAIALKAGGNPLFLRELLLAASRSGSVADLPDSVEAVVTTQIDRLDPGDRTLLRYAAVLGNQFRLADLRNILGRTFDDNALHRISDFVESDGDGRMRFRHALIRDVAYAGLPYRLRRQMHQQVGDAFERDAERREDLADQLALHFFHAGNYEKAWTYSRSAADRARSRYAHIDAIGFLEQALDSAGRLRGTAPSEIAAAHEQLGDVRDLAGLSTEAADAYRRGRRFVVGDPIRVARLMFKEASIAQRVGRFTPSLRLLSNGRAVLAGASGAAADAARSRLATRYGFGKYLQGKYHDAMRWSATGASEARSAGDRDALAYAYNTMHLAYLHAGRPEERPFGELALAIYEELDDLRMQGHCLNNLAIGAMHDGRWDLSSDLLQRAADLFRRVGDTANEANSVYNRADLLIRQGRFAEVEPLLASALGAARAVDDHQLVALVLRERGRMLAGLGRYAEALEVLADARARLTSLDLPQEVIALDGAVADCLVLSGRYHEGAVVVTDALTRARELRAGMLIAPLLRVQAYALLASGRVGEARSVLETGLRSPSEADGEHERALMLMALARITEQHDGDAGDLRDRSREILDRLAVVTVPIARLLA